MYLRQNHWEFIPLGCSNFRKFYESNHNGKQEPSKIVLSRIEEPFLKQFYKHIQTQWFICLQMHLRVKFFQRGTVIRPGGVGSFMCWWGFCYWRATFVATCQFALSTMRLYKQANNTAKNIDNNKFCNKTNASLLTNCKC